MQKIIIPLVMLFFIGSAFTKNSSVANIMSTYKDTTPPNQMKQYWMVFLLKGNNRNQDSVTAAQLQAGHIANIERLAKQGVMVMAGPMGDDTDLRGIFILDAKDSTTAAQYINTDPAVIAGRLRFEIHPWWTMKGTYQFK